MTFGNGTGPAADAQRTEPELDKANPTGAFPSTVRRYRKLDVDQIKTAIRVIEALVTRYPRAFYFHQIRRRPLKVGIHIDLAADGAFTTDEIALALRWYVSNPAYRDRLLAGAERVDLLGAPAGTVTEADAEQAAKSLERLRAKRLAWRASPPPPAPRRLGLADLRAAARARKAVP